MTMFLYRIMLNCYSFCLLVFFPTPFSLTYLITVTVIRMSCCINNFFRFMRSRTFCCLSNFFRFMRSCFSFAANTVVCVGVFVIAYNYHVFFIVFVIAYEYYSYSYTKVSFSLFIAASHISFVIVISIVSVFWYSFVWFFA